MRGKCRDGRTIHKELGMSRPRYERFIHGENTRISLEERKRWNAMGFSDRVIDGETLIKISLLNPTNWTRFFTAWDAYRNGDGEKEAYTAAKEKVDRCIEDTDKDDTSPSEFADVCRFIKRTQPHTDNAEIRLVHTNNLVQSVTPADLLEVVQRTLEEHITILEEALTMAKAIHTIRAYREGWKQKEK